MCLLIADIIATQPLQMQLSTTVCGLYVEHSMDLMWPLHWTNVRLSIKLIPLDNYVHELSVQISFRPVQT